jgi:hypothetical protein
MVGPTQQHWQLAQQSRQVVARARHRLLDVGRVLRRNPHHGTAPWVNDPGDRVDVAVPPRRGVAGIAGDRRGVCRWPGAGPAGEVGDEPVGHGRDG